MGMFSATGKDAPSKLRAIRTPLFWISVVLLAVLYWLPGSVSPYILGLLTVAFYFAVWSMSWDLLFGYAGEVNFGPSFLVALGAYAAGMLNYHFGTPIWLCLVAACVVAVIGGLLMAMPALRVTGPYFGLTTLVAVLIMQNLVIVFAGPTGGEIGLVVPDIITFDPINNYYIALGFMTVSGIILYALSRSPFGLILQAAGQDSVETAALGFNVAKHKVAAFCVSAFFSGLGGALFVFYFGTVSVGTTLSLAVAVQIIIGAVLGGRRTIVGSVLGAIFLIGMNELLRPLGSINALVVSLIALPVVIFVPGGFLGVLIRGGRA